MALTSRTRGFVTAALGDPAAALEVATALDAAANVTPAAADIEVADAGSLLAATTVEGALAELAAHIPDTTAAHAASAISVADAGNLLTATNVEAALAELAAASGGAGRELVLTVGEPVSHIIEVEGQVLDDGVALSAAVDIYLEAINAGQGIAWSAPGGADPGTLLFNADGFNDPGSFRVWRTTATGHFRFAVDNQTVDYPGVMWVRVTVDGATRLSRLSFLGL